MNFKFFIIVSILSYLFNSTNSNVLHNNTSNVTVNYTTQMPSHNITSPFIPVNLGVSCYTDEYSFNNLNNAEIFRRMNDKVANNYSKVVKHHFGNKIHGDELCGLIITKNNATNTYDFKYNVFNMSDCLNKENIICDKGNCKTAMTCCEGAIFAPCNLYGIQPKQSSTCKQINDTKCYEIFFSGDLPTLEPTNDGLAKSYRIGWFIPSIVMYLFSRMLQNIN